MEICELNKELKGKLEKGNRDTLLLYLSQLLTSLSLLINIFVKESEVEQPLTVSLLKYVMFTDVNVISSVRKLVSVQRNKYRGV